MKKYLLEARRSLSLIAGATVLVFMAGTGIATAKTMTTPKDEKKLRTEITMLDKDATLPNGEQVVIDRLAKEFNVTGDQIRGLHGKNLGYGEIAAIYAFADKMSGGITDDNVNKVMTMKEGKKGWGDIATSVDVKVSTVASKLDSLEKDAHKDIKKASAESTGRAGGGMKSDRGGY